MSSSSSSAPSPSSTARLIGVSTPLDPNLLFYRMTGTDGLSQPFEYNLELLSQARQDGSSMLGNAGVTVSLTLGDGSTRYFHGLCTRFAHVGTLGNYQHYEATLRPWLWLLNLSADCRIFQNMAIPDIIKQVFSNLGAPAITDSLTGTYAALDYCVQYRETAFNFVSRLMEREGIYYYFTHAQGAHTMVLIDDVSSHPTGAYSPMNYYPRGQSRQRADHVYGWSNLQQVQTGQYSLQDFDYTQPTVDLSASSATATGGMYEVYDYPGGYADSDGGTHYTGVQYQGARAGDAYVQGEANVRGLAVGDLFKISGLPWTDQDSVQFLVTSAAYQLVLNAYESVPVADEPLFTCRFKAVDRTTPFRPPRITPRSVIRGPQTAIVTGTSGEEIYTEAAARIKVQFHWDRVGTNDQNSSCWIRVAQPWASKTFGFQWIPRIGDEVVVEFLEGDPDRPLITGSVYNAQNTPPLTLPDNKTQSGILTRSSKSGDATTFNQLMFEDLKGSEQVYFYAERDFNRIVGNNDTLKVGFDFKTNGDQTIDIYNNRTVTIENGNESLEVKTGNCTVTIDQGTHTLEVKQGTRTVLVDQSDDVHTIKQGNRTVEIDQGNDTLTIKQGNQSITITSGTCSVSAGQSIELKVGSNSIKIDTSGVTISATKVSIQGQATAELKSPMTTVQGDGTLTLKGGMTMIN
jgi:type VI secretion system secreted protein VgrG